MKKHHYEIGHLHVKVILDNVKLIVINHQIRFILDNVF